MNNVTVRIAASADSSHVSKIAKECWADIYDGYREQLGDDIYTDVYVSPLENKAQRLKIAIEEGRVFVAECDGCICGFSSFLVEGRVGVLKDNAVSKEFQGRGIASMLYEAVFQKLRSEGCLVVRVGTGLDDAHAPARRAYEKAGFNISLSSITYYKKL